MPNAREFITYLYNLKELYSKPPLYAGNEERYKVVFSWLCDMCALSLMTKRHRTIPQSTQHPLKRNRADEAWGSLMKSSIPSPLNMALSPFFCHEAVYLHFRCVATVISSASSIKLCTAALHREITINRLSWAERKNPHNPDCWYCLKVKIYILSIDPWWKMSLKLWHFFSESEIFSRKNKALESIEDFLWVIKAETGLQSFFPRTRHILTIIYDSFRQLLSIIVNYWIIFIVVCFCSLLWVFLRLHPFHLCFHPFHLCFHRWFYVSIVDFISQSWFYVSELILCFRVVRITRWMFILDSAPTIGAYGRFSLHSIVRGAKNNQNYIQSAWLIDWLIDCNLSNVWCNNHRFRLFLNHTGPSLTFPTPRRAASLTFTSAASTGESAWLSPSSDDNNSNNQANFPRRLFIQRFPRLSPSRSRRTVVYNFSLLNERLEAKGSC